MSLEAISEIKKAELQGEAIIKTAEQEAKDIVANAQSQAQKAVERWSSYFICLNDMTVFSGHNGNSLPVNELQNHLL